MQNKLLYIVFVAVLLVSCEEYYKPELDVVPGLMVVESHLTNDPKQNFVKLTKALDFYSQSQADKIEGAKVVLIESKGSSWSGTESGTGYFTFSNTPIPGKTYYLHITWGKDIYESERVVMPPLPNIDTLYTRHEVEKTYRTDAYGSLTPIEIPGRNICIDAPITSLLEYYRFNWRAILQWEYTPPMTPFGPPPPSWYGWKSKYDKGMFNIAGPKEFSLSAKITQHPVLSLEYDTRAFLDSASQIPLGWIVIIDQYGIQKGSYDFQEKLNKQLSAEGSLFDPVLTQVYGNIHCTNDPSKIVVGFFDLNSYRQYRYFLRFGNNEKDKVVQRRINQYPNIPNDGYLIGSRSEFWENYY